MISLIGRHDASRNCFDPHAEDLFLGSVERRFPVPATVHRAAARSLGQGWPQAIAGGDAIAALIQAARGGTLISLGDLCATIACPSSLPVRISPSLSSTSPA